LVTPKEEPVQLIKKGSKGEAVRFCQERLNHHGFLLTADGIFGPATQKVVEQFQASRHLVVDGIVGDKTWDALLLEKRAEVPGDLYEEERVALWAACKEQLGRVPERYQKVVEAVLKVALDDLGKVETPDGSNWGDSILHLVKGYNKYWKIDDDVHRPWCAMAVSSWLKIGLGVKKWEDTPFEKFYGGVSQIETWAKKNVSGYAGGMFASSKSVYPCPGDIFTMGRGGSDSDPSSTVTAGHIGIVLYDDGKYVQTIEGNVSNGVFSRRRAKTQLRWFIRWYAK
jgi:hypothetical protein